jgi:FAD/FMN-containing dehydrogenase
MTNPVERTLQKLEERLAGRLSRPGNEAYAAAAAIWPKPTGDMPRAIAHCRSAEEVQAAVRAARDTQIPLSVRCGGHDWAGRALCGGLVIDLSLMGGTILNRERRSAEIGGGARAMDVTAATDNDGLAVAMGAVGEVGLAGFTLGGGYGALIGRFGLALDNLLGATVVLADGRIVAADPENDAELHWAIRGGGGNFGVVTAMRHRLHDLPSVHSGMLFYPFAEARAVLERGAAIAAAAPADLTVQFGMVAGPDGQPMVFVLPTWCGQPEKGEAGAAPLTKLGTLVGGRVEAMSYGTSLRFFDGQFIYGLPVHMETCWLPSFDGAAIEVLIGAMRVAVSPGCAIVTHEFKGAAARVPATATAFGLRRDHTLIEIIAVTPDPSDESAAERHRRWAQDTRRPLDAMAIPGGYPNLLDGSDPARAAASYGPNLDRLVAAKRRYDPDNLFRSATPLPLPPVERRRRESAGS